MTIIHLRNVWSGQHMQLCRECHTEQCGTARVLIVSVIDTLQARAGEFNCVQPVSGRQWCQQPRHPSAGQSSSQEPDFEPFRCILQLCQPPCMFRIVPSSRNSLLSAYKPVSQKLQAGRPGNDGAGRVPQQQWCSHSARCQ